MSELLSSSGFTLHNTCIIEVEISVSHSEDEKQIDHVQVCDELIDFRGLGKIEKAFVPLLEQVCTWYPSLVECQQKRSPRFREWAFTTLGEVLHFLKTKKVKDMNEDLCNHLQRLWEELETFKFDLSWLEPHLEHALNMKSYISRAEEVKKMKENAAALEMELEKARRDLVRAEEGIE
ncbi:uncharacterized protein LOC130719290 [Lotus japonicus]|uniref:uncharacterized protein LOC130719290 n=1 Tax=Lotus japonicus TaxID=34305 RepID=UPI002590393E|nr:uncharacterized protein LOC130719290 [Lotus japonicus]